MNENISIEELPFRQQPELTDNLIIEDLDNPSVPTSRTTLSEVKKAFSGNISAGGDGFVTGADAHTQIETLKASMNNICNWKQQMSDLLNVLTLDQFVQLKYDCCLVTSSVPDFPADLRKEETAAFLFTNRNEKNGIQELVGARSGIHFSRRMNNGQLTEWTPVHRSSSYYATFSINPFTGQLAMHTEPGYTGANFALENGNITVTI